jgi:hypothetical protein
MIMMLKALAPITNRRLLLKVCPEKCEAISKKNHDRVNLEPALISSNAGSEDKLRGHSALSIRGNSGSALLLKPETGYHSAAMITPISSDVIA